MVSLSGGVAACHFDTFLHRKVFECRYSLIIIFTINVNFEYLYYACKVFCMFENSDEVAEL